MHAPHCVVSYTDTDGISHEVQVYASSVYQAIGQAVQEFRSTGIVQAEPGAMTEFSVSVQRPPVVHKLRFKQVESWANGGGKSPQDAIARSRIKGLLNKQLLNG